MGVKNDLDVAADAGFQKLFNLEVGTEEYEKALAPTLKLVDRIIEIDKCEAEAMDKEEEKALKSKEMKHELIDRCVKHGLTAISVVGGLALTIWGAKASWKFEETGTVTSTAGRKFINNLFSKK